MTAKNIVQLEPLTGRLEALPRRKPPDRYRCKINTLQDIRAEMAKVYRETRSGLLDTSEGSKLVFMLSQISKVISEATLEDRIARLEDHHHEQK